MSLNITPSTSEQLKQLFAEILLSKTTKLNKVSDNSIVSGVSYGAGKIGQKCEKDIILALSKLFPETAFGTQLDQVAQDYGIAARFGASQSSTYVRVVGDVGTTYIAGTHTFTSTTGKTFDIETTATIGAFGFTYIKVRSTDSGLLTNVAPGTISTVSPTPTGHRFVVNEYQATGGRDAESDLDFRQRIKNGSNILARGTIAMIEQAFMLINNNVLSVKYQGINSNGQLQLAIVTQNGIDLNAAELNTLLVQSEEFLALSELRPFGKNSYGLKLINIDWQAIDVSFRVSLETSANVDDVRISIQQRIAKYLDFRNFQAGVAKVEWDTLLDIVKNTKDVKYCPDEYFYPAEDIPTNANTLPRLRGFIMLDLDGNIIDSYAGSFNPIYYPSSPDSQFQATVLATL